MNEQEIKKFWQARARARRQLDKRLASLPFEEKLQIMKQMEEAHALLRKAKRVD